MMFEHFEHAGEVPVTMYHSWSTNRAKGSVKGTYYQSEMLFTDMRVGWLMEAIIQNMVFKLHFLCTPIPLESLEVFKERSQGMSDDEIEQELQSLANEVMAIMAQKNAIPSALTPSLTEGLNNNCICHIFLIVSIE